MGSRIDGLTSGRLLGLLALVAVLLALPLVSAATRNSISPTMTTQGGAPSNVFRACADKTTGALRTIYPLGPCTANESAVFWNIQGPAGPAGAPGVSALERVDFSSRSDDTRRKNAFAQCPEGKLVVGGGAQVFIAGGASSVVALLKKSQPSDTMDGWAATAETIDGEHVGMNWFLTSYALCAMVQQ